MKYSEITASRMQQFTDSATDTRLEEARKNIKAFITTMNMKMRDIRNRMEKLVRNGRAWNKWWKELDEADTEWSYATWAFDLVSYELQKRYVRQGKSDSDLFKDTREFLTIAAGMA